MGMAQLDCPSGPRSRVSRARRCAASARSRSISAACSARSASTTTWSGSTCITTAADRHVAILPSIHPDHQLAMLQGDQHRLVVRQNAHHAILTRCDHHAHLFVEQLAFDGEDLQPQAGRRTAASRPLGALPPMPRTGRAGWSEHGGHRHLPGATLSWSRLVTEGQRLTHLRPPPPRPAAARRARSPRPATPPCRTSVPAPRPPHRPAGAGSWTRSRRSTRSALRGR